MRILFLGDIVGRPGRKAVTEALPRLRRQLGLDLALANAENASGGLGVNAKAARELLSAGFDMLTSGNHIWRYKDIYNFLIENPRLLRPANYPEGAPGNGLGLYESPGGEPYAVINLMGRTYMEAVDCPFQTAQSLLDTIPGDVRVRLVDFHAEATSEKRAMGYFLDGRVSAVLGTHTHVQTADAQVLPRGTAYMTDLGMCGPAHSVLGMDATIIVNRFLNRLPARFEVAKNPASLAGALIDIDPKTGQALAVSPWKGE